MVTSKPVSAERAVISCLVSGSKREVNKFLRSGINFSDFRTCQLEVAFLEEFFSREGRFPNKTLFVSRFPQFSFLTKLEPIEHYLELIHERESYDRLRKVTKKAFSKIDAGNFWEGVGIFQKELADIASPDSVSDVDISADAASRLESAWDVDTADKPIVFPLPWDTLNSALGGFEEGDLVSLMARTSIGKTWVMLKWVMHLWSLGLRVLFVSKEMPEERIARRIDALGAKISNKRMRSGGLTDEEKERYRKWVESLQRRRGSFIVTGKETMKGTGLMDIHSRMLRYRPDVVFIDAAYRMARSGPDMVRGMIELSETLLRMAQSTRIPIVSSYQMNRSGEQSGGKTSGGMNAIAWGDVVNSDSSCVLALQGDRNDSVRTLQALKWRESGLSEVEISLFDDDDVPTCDELTLMGKAEKDPEAIRIKKPLAPRMGV